MIEGFSSKNTITMEKFNQIKTGMTYSQVVDIIGFDGTLSIQDGTNQIYRWNKSKMYITIIFENGRVSDKYSNRIEMIARYNKVKENSNRQSTELDL